jgi:hypothetical protein
MFYLLAHGSWVCCPCSTGAGWQGVTGCGSQNRQYKSHPGVKLLVDEENDPCKKIGDPTDKFGVKQAQSQKLVKESSTTLIMCLCKICLYNSPENLQAGRPIDPKLLARMPGHSVLPIFLCSGLCGCC